MPGWHKQGRPAPAGKKSIGLLRFCAGNFGLADKYQTQKAFIEMLIEGLTKFLSE
jgi:hypothetical protein